MLIFKLEEQLVDFDAVSVIKDNIFIRMRLTRTHTVVWLERRHVAPAQDW